MEDNSQKEKTIRTNLKKPSILMILIGVALILTLINLYWTANLANQIAFLTDRDAGILNEAQPQQPSQEQGQQPSRIEVSVGDNPRSIGPEDAPITIIEFSDYRCPFCAKVRPTIKQILETYGNKIRFVFRDFPILGPESQKAAEAARCANEQGKFWEYQALLFANQQALDVPNLKQFAADLGLNTSDFNDCLNSRKMAQKIEKDIRDGQNYGVRGTPTFFVNGILVSGAQPFQVFQEIIERELNNR